jgi:hypothetical protein
MPVSTDKSWFAQLDEESVRRQDEQSFHVFAEGRHSDIRGQIYSLQNGDKLELPHAQWPRHLFIVVGIHGDAEAHLEGRVVALRAHSQLVVLPGTPCTLRARSPVSFELISLLSIPPESG